MVLVWLDPDSNELSLSLSAGAGAGAVQRTARPVQPTPPPALPTALPAQVGSTYFLFHAAHAQITTSHPEVQARAEVASRG